jgi:hypothetical protein
MFRGLFQICLQNESVAGNCLICASCRREARRGQRPKPRCPKCACGAAEGGAGAGQGCKQLCFLCFISSGSDMSHSVAKGAWHILLRNLYWNAVTFAFAVVRNDRASKFLLSPVTYYGRWTQPWSYGGATHDAGGDGGGSAAALPDSVSETGTAWTVCVFASFGFEICWGDLSQLKYIWPAALPGQ